MKHGPIVLTEQGSNTFWAYDAWKMHCVKEHIQDPWKLEEKIRNEFTHHYKTIDEKGYDVWHIDYDEPTEDQKERLKKAHEYRDEYMAEREKWVGNYLFENFGYNTLSKFAQTHVQGKTAPSYDRAFNNWYAKVYPCEGADKQCNFACPVFNSCPYQEQGIYRNDVDYSAKWDN